MIKNEIQLAKTFGPVTDRFFLNAVIFYQHRNDTG